ncbi:CMT1A duplicated region transcript 1 protein-like [Dendronephthya gigantea]|uniref:CMT1A duplicated region transcript 1 protein-like n=1 Tax=Dendronephthya gigantea TaxID=151771 RepID=UPI00106A7158|nr:CMT1A duplicated region transcript 1 protein-like [Dendronephthya gigantea]
MMEPYFDNSTAISELSIHNAPQLRCNGEKFTTCGKCESCELGSQLLYTKEWFPRCSEQTQRQFVLGLVHRYNSIDLHEYTNHLLNTLEGKDFIYSRSRNRPSLKEDMSGAVSNHALNRSQLKKDILDCLNWFESSSYWTKCNFMLGLLQSCNAQLLHIIGNESRSFCLVHDDQYLSETESKYVEDIDESSNQNDGTSLKVTFSSIYKTSSNPPTPDVTLNRPKQKAASLASSDVKTKLSQVEGSILTSLRGTRPASGSVKNRNLNTCDDVLTDLPNDELYEDDYISVEPSSITDLQLSSSCLLLLHHKDFIRCLPVHLSKLILSYLDKASLINCLCISKHWRILCEEVQQDVFVHQIMMEEVMMMQGATAKGLSPKYAMKLNVCIPMHKDESQNEEVLAHSFSMLRCREDELQFRSMSYCYEGIETVKVEMEERNLFCGAYNVFVLQDSEDPNRCTTYNGGSMVAVGSSDRRVRLVNASTGRTEKIIKGHSGSVRSLLINEKRGFVLSGSYDTSIRCWGIRDGKCSCIFRGHKGTILCLALSGNSLASGSRDKSVKVWNFETGKCRRTFRHRHVVLCVDISDNLVVSGCEGWKVKVWDIESATLVKSLEGHQAPVSGVTFNKYHIVSASTDCYALAWSTIGNHTKCLQAFRHPKAVDCIKLVYCRVITGAADGKLRIWSLLTGDCLRIIRGNSKNDVITSLYVADNRIVINTLSNLLVLNFEAVIWNYNLPPDRPESLGTLNNFASSPAQPRPHSYIRAQKLARGAHMDKLIQRAASTPSFNTLLERSVSMTPFSLQRKSRVSSAPVNVTRQVSHSIEQHVLRLHQARQHTGNKVERQVKSRPQSSPAHLRTYANKTTNNSSVLPLEGCFFDKERMRTPGHSLGSRLSHHNTRRHYTAATEFNSKHHGWTTSADDVVLAQNKLMPTAEQTREHVKRRPQTADFVKVKNVDSTMHQTSSMIPQTTSGLNLRTYSEQLEAKATNQTGWPRKKHTINKTKRPLSCFT